MASVAICALLSSNFAKAVQVHSAESQQLEDESFLQIDAAFDDAFQDMKEEVPASSTLLQIGKVDGVRFVQTAADESSSDSDSSDSESEPEDHQHIQQFEEQDGEVETEKSESEIKEGNLMQDTSNAKDTGKLSGYSPSDSKITQIFDEYTGADNDEFMKELVEDFGTKEKKTDANPGGIVLTKWNGERATRKFL